MSDDTRDKPTDASPEDGAPERREPRRGRFRDPKTGGADGKGERHSSGRGSKPFGKDRFRKPGGRGRDNDRGSGADGKRRDRDGQGGGERAASAPERSDRPRFAGPRDRDGGRSFGKPGAGKFRQDKVRKDKDRFRKDKRERPAADREAPSGDGAAAAAAPVPRRDRETDKSRSSDTKGFARRSGKPSGKQRPGSHRGKQRPGSAEPPRGFDAREEAVDLIEWVVARHKPLDDALARSATTPGLRKLRPNDRAFARLMAATALRRHGQIAAVIGQFMDKPLDAAAAHTTAILHAGAAQLLFLAAPAHAVVSIAVEQARANPSSARFERLVNALLRRVDKEGPAIVAAQDPVALNVPGWMLARWTATYGEATARRIAAASLAEAPLDLSVKSDPEHWARELGGELLSTGTVRLAAGGRVDHLPGFEDGAWWVQDAAAALPAKLLGDVKGLRVADLCAAPGGKTMQLAAAGARVTAVDSARERLDRVRQNLARTKLTAETVVADVMHWTPPEAFDAVLVDVPCTAAGTIRRHPDIPHLKRESDIASLAETQARLLRAAARLVKPGGLLVYCSCSLEPEEGEAQIGRYLATTSQLEIEPVRTDEVGGLIECVTQRGFLRTLPCHLDRGPPAQSGLDGFFAARLRKKR